MAVVTLALALVAAAAVATPSARNQRPAECALFHTTEPRVCADANYSLLRPDLRTVTDPGELVILLLVGIVLPLTALAGAVIGGYRGGVALSGSGLAILVIATAGLHRPGLLFIPAAAAAITAGWIGSRRADSQAVTPGARASV